MGKCTTIDKTKTEMEGIDTSISTAEATIIQNTTLVNDIRAQLKGSHPLTVTGLAIGDTGKTAVATAAIDYNVDGVRYSLAADTTGVALGTTSITATKFGAVALDAPISGGTVVSTEAPANAAGYASAVLAAAALPAVAAAHCRLGYVTVSLSGGPFILGTTALDAVNSTVAYTDADTLGESIGAAVS